MWVFGVMDQAGEPLAWVGRDLAFEKKREAWEKAGRSGESPAKYRFPSKNYFRRKFELYGQHALSRTEYKVPLEHSGLTVTEGFNDVLKLRTLGVPSVGLMSNRATPQQIGKIVNISKRRVSIMLDADSQGDRGAKEALWHLTVAKATVNLAWSFEMMNGKFENRETETVTEEELHQLTS